MPGSDSAEAEYAKATAAEMARDWDAAFTAYVSAAQRFVQAKRVATTEQQRNAAHTGAEKALRRAELIKKARGTMAPVVVDAFSNEEQMRILEKSSVTNQQRTLRWDDTRPTNPQEFHVQPALNPEQIAHGAVWRRTSQTVTNLHPALVPEDVVQYVVGDCSVCASLVICIEHRRRFGSSLCDDLITTQDAGRYHARLLHNGTHRRVAIDDSLPFSGDSPPIALCMSTKTGDHLLSLIEKAYIKLMGGYDFPGSISSNDLYCLIGWIPEHISLSSSDFQLGKTWERLSAAFSSGKCLITMGTGMASSLRWHGLCLLPVHCYAVIDLRETDDGERIISLMDSRVTATDVADQLEELSLEGERQASSNRITVTYEEAVNAFHGLYVSWDPQIFKEKLVFHGGWTPHKNEEDQSCSATYNLYLSVEPTVQESEIWIQMTRHVSNTNATTEFVALHAQIQDDPGDSGAIHVGKQVSFTNSPHTLLRMPLPERSEATQVAIVGLYEGTSSDELGFTLTVYSHSPIAWRRNIRPLPFSKKVTGDFTEATSGRNSAFPTWMNNPQYKLKVLAAANESATRSQTPARLTATLRGARELPLNLTIAWGEGERIFELAQNDIVLTSGDYAHGFATASTNLRPGSYTVIVSTYEPNLQGPFTLTIESARPIEITPILPEGAGMYSKTVRGQWSEQNAAGGPSYGQYDLNPTYQVNVPTACNMKLRLRLVNSAPTAALNVTLFEREADGSKGKRVATSGAYADTPAGVCADATVKPGKYLLVCSTYNPGVLARFRLLIYSSASGVGVSQL